MQRNWLEGAYNDPQREMQRSTENKQNANDLLKQIEERKHAADMAKQAGYRESEEIQRQARLYEGEMEKLAKLKMEEKRELMKSNLAHIADRDLIRALEKQTEDDDDELIKRYVLAKKEMANLKMKKEEELFSLNAARSDKITEQLATQMKQKLDDEEERLSKALEEMELKLNKESLEKEEKKKYDQQGITDHRMARRRMKEEEEMEDKMKGMQDLSEKRDADNYYFAQQKEKKQRAKDECRNVQTMQIQQMAEKKAMAQAEKKADIEFDKQKDEEAGQNPLDNMGQKGTGRAAYRNTTQQQKENNDAGDIEEGKRRLGFAS